MICPECQAEGEKSRVTLGGGSSTAMYAAPFYDEEGRYHNHDPNVFTYAWSCSRGHRGMESHRYQCWCEQEKP